MQSDRKRKRSADSNELNAALLRKKAEAFQRKKRNKAVIIDTLASCETLAQLFGLGRTHMYMLPAWTPRPCDEWKPTIQRMHMLPVSVEIIGTDCVTIAKDLAKKIDARVWMLNMACARSPGGGTREGCNAQEEHLCRCSDLLPQLEAAATDAFPLHAVRRAGKDFKVLVHKRVTFFKDPQNYSDLNIKEWFRTGVITAAAENISKTPQSATRRSNGDARKTGPNAERFINYLLEIIQMQGGTHVILSAWGCGAFGQSAHAVAEIFRRGLARFDGRSFPKVVFAIIDDHNSAPPGNLHAFRTVFA